MKQFWKIFQFEFNNYLANKVFVGVTLAIVVLITGVMFFPRVKEAVHQDKPAEPTEKEVLLIGGSAQNTAGVAELFSQAFTGFEVKTANGDAQAVRQEVASGKAACAFWMDSPISYTYYVNNLTLYDVNTAMADGLLQNSYRVSAMVAAGIPPELAQTIMSTAVTHKTETIGKDQAENFFYAYIMIFALYMVILMYGQMVALNVATEKSSRAMELLITSAKPVSMMFGKVMASCLAGLIQLTAIFGTSILTYNLNKGYWKGNRLVESLFDMPPEMLGYMLLFFMLGFFLYAFMYGAVGSTVSKLEDVNTAVMPVTMLFIVGFFVVIFSMSSGNIDNSLMKVCSYIPFTSPMAMFTRLAMSTVPWYGILASIGLLVVSVVGIGILSAKIYRVGVLLYGTTPKLGSILRSIWKA